MVTCLCVVWIAPKSNLVTPSTQLYQDNVLRMGEFLRAGHSIASVDRKFTAELEYDCNLVVYHNRGPGGSRKAKVRVGWCRWTLQQQKYQKASLLPVFFCHILSRPPARSSRSILSFILS